MDMLVKNHKNDIYHCNLEIFVWTIQQKASQVNIIRFFAHMCFVYKNRVDRLRKKSKEKHAFETGLIITNIKNLCIYRHEIDLRRDENIVPVGATICLCDVIVTRNISRSRALPNWIIPSRVDVVCWVEVRIESVKNHENHNIY